MKKDISRRSFMQTSFATATALAFPGLDALAQSISTGYTTRNYVDAIIEIESHGDPKAARYEPKLNDWSYGLGQILTRTAKDVERKHPNLPRLGETPEQIKSSLFNPVINRKYTTTIFLDEDNFYHDPFVSVAAYNSGHIIPKLARYQEQLNDTLGVNLKTDGLLGKKSRIAVKQFQSQYNLGVDGLIGKNTRRKLNKIWEENFPGIDNPIGIIPQNGFTPFHVEKFRKALKNPK